MNRSSVVTFLAVGVLLAACGGTAATASPTTGGGTPTAAITGGPATPTPLVTPSPSGPLPPTPTFGGTNEPPIGGGDFSAFPPTDPPQPPPLPPPPPPPPPRGPLPAP